MNDRHSIFNRFSPSGRRRALVGRLVPLVLLAGALGGCGPKVPPYGTEEQLILPGAQRQVWAVAPAINLSGERGVDPLLQADLLFSELQQVRGLVVIPVNRTAEAYAALGIDRVQTEEEAHRVCELLGCDALIVASISAFDPYNPPKMGAALQLFRRPANYTSPEALDPRRLTRQDRPGEELALPRDAGFLQSVGLFDASNGSVREKLGAYAAGRNDPAGPLKEKEYLVSMDRYGGFVYHQLIDHLLSDVRRNSR